MMSLVLPAPSKNGLFFQWIGGIKIYRPNPSSEIDAGKKAEAFLREKFGPGSYSDPKRTQEILHHQVDFYGSRIDELIPDLASRGFLEFLLWQYDQCGIVEDRRKNGELNGEALNRWIDVNHLYPRAIKYLAERITMVGPAESADKNKPDWKKIDEITICAEQLVSYCITSDLTRLMPDKTVIDIQEAGNSPYLEHSVTDERMDGLNDRIYADARARSSLFEGPDYELNSLEHAKLLDKPLLNSIGVSYSEVLSILQHLQFKSRPASDDWSGTKFIPVERFVSDLAQTYKKPKESIEKMLSGLWLTKEQIASRARLNEDLWKPNTHYRAYRRALFVLPHSLGPHIAFSDRMLSESQIILRSGVSFGILPKEWLSEEVKAALGKIDTARGHWFEVQIGKALKSINIMGLVGRESLGQGMSAIKLPGEFDFIGWSENDSALILIEAKMLQPASEPGLWKNQCDRFVAETKGGDENFVQKLRRKNSWLASNAIQVCEALKTEGITIEKNPRTLNSCFLSFTPLAASYFTEEFPCIALSEFMAEYKAAGSWPYETGVRAIAT